MGEQLHIVSFDVPFPANYGGIIDVYYKLVALKQQGVKITLHCFNYGRKPAPELEQWCEKVIYYERKTGFFSNLSLLPYTVKSRQSQQLEENLLKDNAPILFEVLHTCYLLKDRRFVNRKKIYRHSNIEHEYYNELSRSERSLLKKIYLKTEAWKLKRFESILNYADLILAVNQKDTLYFQKKYPQVKSLYLPSFHPNNTVQIRPGTGNFILFHGNLSISENYEAAAWLIKHVFSKLNVKCVIAGLSPPAFLAKLIQPCKHIELIAGPDEASMENLLQNAQAHILYTAQPTGLKLKLLNVLFKGRFVICNANMVSGTSLQAGNTLFICNTAADFIRQIRACMDLSFSQALIDERREQLADFDNTPNAKKLIAAIF